MWRPLLWISFFASLQFSFAAHSSISTETALSEVDSAHIGTTSTSYLDGSPSTTAGNDGEWTTSRDKALEKAHTEVAASPLASPPDSTSPTSTSPSPTLADSQTVVSKTTYEAVPLVGGPIEDHEPTQSEERMHSKDPAAALPSPTVTGGVTFTPAATTPKDVHPGGALPIVIGQVTYIPTAVASGADLGYIIGGQTLVPASWITVRSGTLTQTIALQIEGGRTELVIGTSTSTLRLTTLTSDIAASSTTGNIGGIASSGMISGGSASGNMTNSKGARSFTIGMIPCVIGVLLAFACW